MAKFKWEKDVEVLNKKLVRISLLGAKAMAESDYKYAQECFKHMAHLSSEKACTLRKTAKTHKNAVEAHLMNSAAGMLFSSRADWLTQARLVAELEERRGTS